MSDLPPLPPGYTIRGTGDERTRLTIDDAVPPPPPGYTIRPPETPPAMAPSAPVGRSFEDTALIRGLQSFGGFLADPMAPIRKFVSPGLAAIEEEQNRQAAVPPLSEIIRRAGDAAFPAFGVQEYKPATPMGGLGESAATGAVAGAPGGPIGVLLGAAGNTAGYIARQALGEPKEGDVDWTTRAEILASMLPGGVANRMGVRARSRETQPPTVTSPPPGPPQNMFERIDQLTRRNLPFGQSWENRAFPPSEMEARGVNPTLGQAMGGAFNRLEQGLASIPFLGDFIKTGRARAEEQYNIGGINRALGNVGEQLDPNTPMGRRSINEADSKVGARYDAITPELNFTLDSQFGTGLTNVFREVSMLGDDFQKRFTNTFRTQVLDKLTGSNMTGENFRSAESKLGQIAKEFLHSTDPDQRAYGSIVNDLQSELRANLRRSNPEKATELGDIHRAYAELARIELAAARMGTGLGGVSEPGVFTPAQLTSAVWQMDPSLRKRDFARGRALMQDYAEMGQKLMGGTVPDSGTPYRSLATLGAGVGIGSGFDPTLALMGGGAGLGLGAFYSPQGRAAMNYFLRRPEQAALAGLLAGQNDYLQPSLEGR